MDIKKIFGQNLKKYRNALGYTQMQLAEKINVDQKHISFIESGNSFPSASLIAKISETLNIHPKRFFDTEDKISIDTLKKDIYKIIETLSYDDISKLHNYICFINCRVSKTDRISDA